MNPAMPFGDRGYREADPCRPSGCGGPVPGLGRLVVGTDADCGPTRRSSRRDPDGRRETRLGLWSRLACVHTHDTAAFRCALFKKQSRPVGSREPRRVRSTSKLLTNNGTAAPRRDRWLPNRVAPPQILRSKRQGPLLARASSPRNRNASLALWRIHGWIYREATYRGQVAPTIPGRARSGKTILLA